MRIEEIEKLRQIMKEKGLTYEDTSRSLHVSFQTVYRWLVEGRKPSKLALWQIRRFIKKHENLDPLTE